MTSEMRVMARVQLKAQDNVMVFENEAQAYTYIKLWLRELDITPLDFLSLLISGEVKMKRMSK